MQNGQKGPYVYVVKADMTAELRPVKPGADKDGLTAILEGVAEGETVVSDGHLRVAPGAQITVIQDAAAEATAK